MCFDSGRDSSFLPSQDFAHILYSVAEIPFLEVLLYSLRWPRRGGVHVQNADDDHGKAAPYKKDGNDIVHGAARQ